jgi:hypothetical protein
MLMVLTLGFIDFSKRSANITTSIKSNHMSQFRYVAFIDGEKMRAFHSKDELHHWLRDKPEATYVKYSVKRKPKEKMDFSQFEEAPF